MSRSVDRSQSQQIPGYRHFLGDPSADQRFKIFGEEPHASKESTQKLRKLMSGLAARMAAPFPWPPHAAAAADGSPVEKWENPNLPAGYTYFLQLMAHDIVQTSVPISVIEDASAGVRNSRMSRLRLDTIYGFGPLVCPFAYAIDSTSAGARTKLRLSPMRHRPDQEPSPHALRDIGRTTGEDDIDAADARTEPLIPDPRNDDHAILSQLTALFHLLHNGILKLLPPPEWKVEAESELEASYERFYCARGAVTLIYRNVIRKDVMQRLLHPKIYEAYRVAQPQFIDTGSLGQPAPTGASAGKPDGAKASDKKAAKKDTQTDKPASDKQDVPASPQWQVPLEFSHAAFRFGHAMVRNSYRINDGTNPPFRLDTVLKRTCELSPRDMPFDERWIIRWSHFFALDPRMVPNLSRRIGPEFSAGLLSEDLFGPFDNTESIGLAYRDLLSSGLLGLWSVSSLVDEIRKRAPHFIKLSRLLADPDYRRQRLTSWLSEQKELSNLTEEDIATLANDPPLPFFILFEAAHRSDDDAREDDSPRGMRLGVLGSIIVAEVIFGALAADPLPAELDAGSLRDALANLSNQIYQADYFANIANIAEIDDMPKLIRFTAAVSGLERASPSFV